MSEDTLETGNPFQIGPVMQGLLNACEPEACFRVELNGAEVLLPAGTILTMAHCLRIDENKALHLAIETAHLDWMRSRLTPGSVFLDVGAATGAMTLPIAIQHPGVEIIAFEPARRARSLLTLTLVKNSLLGVKVLSDVVSDKDEDIHFSERPVSADGSCPFLPETSTIVSGQDADPTGDVFKTKSVTLDSFAKSYGISQRNVVVKLDIEGFEGFALLGAADLFAQNQLHIAIDIHKDPNGLGTTEQQCREILSLYGYDRSEMMGHVLLCSRH